MLEAVNLLFASIMPGLGIIAGIGLIMKKKLIGLMYDPTGGRDHEPRPGHEIGFING